MFVRSVLTSEVRPSAACYPDASTSTATTPPVAVAAPAGGTGAAAAALNGEPVAVVLPSGGGGEWLTSSDRDVAEHTPKAYKKRKTDVAHELSALVVYTQAVKFRGYRFSKIPFSFIHSFVRFIRSSSNKIARKIK